MWFLVALFVVSLAASLLLTPKVKVENARASGLNDLQFPRNDDGAPLPLILGRVKMDGPNTLWVGDFTAEAIKKKQKTGLFSSKKVIVGYTYYVGIQLGLSIGPCTLHTIWSDKDVLWSGTANADGQALNINLPNLWGGKEKGGGFVGTLRYYTGGFAQGINAYLESKIGAGDVPAYRGTSHLVFEHPNIGESNQLRAMSMELSRYTNGLGLAGGIDRIGDDLNPMELLYQAFTLDWGGLDVTPDLLDLDSLKACAATLYAENNGMSVCVASANAGKDIADEVMRQVDALMYADPLTGKIVVKLIRNDYDVEDLPIFDESNVITVRNFNSKLWEDTINQVRVKYSDRSNKYADATAMVQDMANINAQGRIRSITNSYPGVTNGTLATELATRDLTQGSVPLLAASLELNRQGAALRPGDPFLWAWSAYGIEQVVMRVKTFDLGALNDNRIAIDCNQDDFAVDLTVFSPPSGEGSGVQPPNDPAVAAPKRLVREGAYFFAAAGGLSLNGEQSVIVVSAKAPTGSEEYDVYTSTDNVNYNPSEENIVYTPYATLNTAITATQDLDDGIIASVTITTDSDELEANTAAEIAQGYGMFYIGAELFAYQGLTDNGDGTFTLGNVRRALLDTIPTAHNNGDDVWFILGDNVVDDAFGWTAALRVKMTPRTFRDSLDVATAPFDAITLQKRAMRPLRPAYVRFDGGTAFAPPADASGAHTVTWANRNRLSATVLSIVDPASDYEPGQQTVFRYRKNAGAWTALTLSPGVSTVTFDAAAAGGDTVDYEIYSTRDGLDSFSKWTFSATGGGGSSSTGGSNPDTGGGTPPDTTPTYTAPADPVSIVFPFGENIGLYPIDMPVTYKLKIPDNFAGSNADVRTNASATSVFTVKKNGSSVGTVSISTGGVATFNTTGAGVDLAAGDTLTIEPPNPADSLLKGVTITIAASKDLT